MIVTQLADLLGGAKRTVYNFQHKWLAGRVPTYSLKSPVCFSKMIRSDAASATPYGDPIIYQNDLAVIQYTSGTEGVPKGVMLSHGNLVANTLQCMEIFKTYGLQEGKEVLVMPLPLYHIYSFLVSMILFNKGNQIVLVPDPRNIPELIDVEFLKNNLNVTHFTFKLKEDSELKFEYRIAEFVRINKMEY